MDDNDEFEGTPWQSKPTEEWNDSSFWEGYYRKPPAKPKSWEFDQVVHRRIDYLIRTLTGIGELPRRATPLEG